MSYFHTSYSSLEDAWGDNLKQKRKSKNPNSVCDLYNNRKASVTKPFSPSKSNKNVNLNDDDIKYYGYSDAHKYTRKDEKKSTYNLRIPNESPDAYQSDEEFEENVISRPSVNKSDGQTNSTCYTSEEKYSNPLYKRKPTDRQATKHTDTGLVGNYKNNQFANVSDDVSDSEDEFDMYLNERMSKKNIEAEEEYNYMLNEEEAIHEEEGPGFSSLISNQKFNLELLDVVLYSVSGILLIFIMEQFIQIGTHMKKINTNI